MGGRVLELILTDLELRTVSRSVKIRLLTYYIFKVMILLIAVLLSVMLIISVISEVETTTGPFLKLFLSGVTDRGS